MIVRRIDGEWLTGYAEVGFAAHTNALELLELSGKVQRLEWPRIKWVCQLRDLPASSPDPLNPERLLHKKFALRPRTPGLWLRLTLADGDQIEGLAANDRSLLDSPGLWIIPPDTRSITQRIFLPHPAIQTLEVLAVVGSPLRKHRAVPAEQPRLFPVDPFSITEM